MSDSRPILSAIEQGNSHAADALLPLVHDELPKLAPQMQAHAQGGLGEVFVAHDQQLHRDTYLGRISTQPERIHMKQIALRIAFADSERKDTPLPFFSGMLPTGGATTGRPPNSEGTRRPERGRHMTTRGLLAALALCCLPAAAFAQANGGEGAKGGAIEVILGLLCMVAALGGAGFGLVWLIRRKKARAARGGFEGGFEGAVRGAIASGMNQALGGFEEGFQGAVRGAIASGTDEAFERHRRRKQAGERQDPEQPSADPPCYVRRQGQQQGPFTRARLQALAAAGQLDASDLVWVQGAPQWVPAGQLAGLSIAAPVPPPLPQPVAAAAVQPAAGGFYYSRQGQRLGPVSSKQLRKMAATGQLHPTDLVWIEAKQEWIPATKVKGLFPR